MTNFVARLRLTSARPTWIAAALHLLATLWLILTPLLPLLLARAQQPGERITLLDVTTRAVSNTTLVTITADGSLSHAQTWENQEGYHVVIPGGRPSEALKPGSGYKVGRSGSAVEVLLFTKPGTPVQVRTDNKSINLSITGALENGDSASSVASSQGYSLPDYGKSSNTSPANTSPTDATSSNKGEGTQQASSSEGSPVEDGREVASTITAGEPQSGTIFNSIFSWTGAIIVMVLGAAALFLAHRRKDSGWEDEPAELVESDEEAGNSERRSAVKQVSKTKYATAQRAEASNTKGRESKRDIRPAAPPPVSLYSAYRIGQEVRKLALGQPHRTEVIASRASDDRRAIKTSLIKILATQESSEEERMRARTALETYGFVPRERATLLSASDPFERTMAARTLGEIGSVEALPALFEALHDSESIVRNQVITSIGELKHPSAIGPLIDAARNRPELPAGLVVRALAACSLEPVDLLDASLPSFSSALVNDSGPFDFAQLGQTESSIEELPETIEDESLNEALRKAKSENVEERSEAVKTLAQYPVKSAIAMLVSMAKYDAESVVRSLALSSLGFIDHELVFPAVLIGMADESRDVRAAAARALSRLSFDRSAAYGTLVRTADDQTLRDVGQACIKAGIVSQNIDRLASRDRRQAYEAFCLISLLAKARMPAPVLEAIERHQNMVVRLSAIHLFASTGDEVVFEQLQQIAGNEAIDEEIKIAALNEMYSIQQEERRERERRNDAQTSRVHESEPASLFSS